jgi:glycine/D-amino acid oxidase-like deaminating enzyme
MRPIVIERGDLGQGASGVNAGTLSLQIKRVKLMPYALRGHHEWEAMGSAVGFKKTGGVTLAFNAREADLLHERMEMKRAAGAPIRFMTTKEVAEFEPGLVRGVTAASFCPEDGFANSSLTGQYYRRRLADAGIPVCEHAPVQGIERVGDGFDVRIADRAVSVSRVLLAAGGWMKQVAAMLGLDLPIRARINTVSVTEPGPTLIKSVIGHATGLLTMKQKQNGTMLIGGGWQGLGRPEDGRGDVSAESLLTNLRLANFAVPALADWRVVRSWTGFEANVPDFYPLAGAAPGIPNAYLLGCVRGGYTIGPYISKLMGDLILGRDPELPLFDPGRQFNME